MALPDLEILSALGNHVAHVFLRVT